jgi:hypothetical protein
MRTPIRDNSVRTLQQAFDEMESRISATENFVESSLLTTPPKSPQLGQVWYSVEDGKIRVWNGSSWDAYSKD